MVAQDTLAHPNECTCSPHTPHMQHIPHLPTYLGIGILL